jgi:16S rRNA processing protein RimM
LNKNQLFHLGYIQRTQGFKGHVVVVFDVDDPTRYRNIETIFVEEGPGNFAERQVIAYELNRNNTCTLLLEHIDSFEKAQPLLKKNVFLPLHLLPQLDDRSFYFHEITGFKVVDKEHGEIGIAEAVISTTAQDILQVKKGRVEILIPLKKEFIVSVDREKKILHIDPPAGLVDMYLGKQDEEE